MAFTYDLTTDRGKVRLLLSDTDSSAYVFEDDEIDYFLTLGTTVKGAAVEGARVLLADKARRMKRFTLHGMTYDDTAAVAALQALIAEYGGTMATASTSLTLHPFDEGYDDT